MIFVTARDKFKTGKRVRITAEGRVYLIPPPGRPLDDSGRVVGYGRRHNVVRVLRDGHRCAESFHMDFWSPA